MKRQVVVVLHGGSVVAVAHDPLRDLRDDPRSGEARSERAAQRMKVDHAITRIALVNPRALKISAEGSMSRYSLEHSRLRAQTHRALGAQFVREIGEQVELVRLPRLRVPHDAEALLKVGESKVPEKADKLLIDTAKSDYIDVASSNPQTMGKSKACYSRLRSFADLIASN